MVVVAGLVTTGGAAAPATGPSAGDGSAGGQWAMSGQNLNNTRSNPNEHQISPDNVATMTPKWSVTTAGNVTSTPTVFGGTVYFSDQGGSL